MAVLMVQFYALGSYCEGVDDERKVPASNIEDRSLWERHLAAIIVAGAYSAEVQATKAGSHSHQKTRLAMI